jgi:hypothetical protein
VQRACGQLALRMQMPLGSLHENEQLPGMGTSQRRPPKPSSQVQTLRAVHDPYLQGGLHFGGPWGRGCGKERVNAQSHAELSEARSYPLRVVATLEGATRGLELSGLAVALELLLRTRD